LLKLNHIFNQKNPNKTKIRNISILVAISLAFAISSKYIAGAMLLFIFFYLILNYFFIPSKKKKILLFSVIIILLITPSIFYFINPQFQKNPVKMLKNTFDFWDMRNTGHQKIDPGSALITLRERFHATNRVLIDFSTFFIFYKLPIGLFFFILGALSCIAIIYQKARTAFKFSDLDILLLWPVFMFIIFYLWLPLAWAKYCLLPFVATPLIIAFGLLVFIYPFLPKKIREKYLAFKNID
ncbi:phospholipid carrier-dependent glycosyltransferase, partial [Candidatus Woesearchaeota archaeon]|nr:phospholipid carrier-dependent glycosyltransferase [Candidatus Woesearchaeota archaeon]